MRKQDELSKLTSCLNKATNDEMIFVLLGRDKAAPVAIRAWIAERIRLGKNTARDAQIQEAAKCALTMETNSLLPPDGYSVIETPNPERDQLKRDVDILLHRVEGLEQFCEKIRNERDELKLKVSAIQSHPPRRFREFTAKIKDHSESYQGVFDNKAGAFAYYVTDLLKWYSSRELIDIQWYPGDEPGSVESFKQDQSPRPKIVCLCGSTRFKQAWYDQTKQLTYDGIIVLGVGDLDPNYPTMNVPIGVDLKRRLDKLQKRKIDLADEILVLNVGGYIGESTRSEIEYAKAINKPVRYLEANIEPVKNDPYERAKQIRQGKLDDEMPIYEELTGWLQRCPQTMLPALLCRIVQLCMVNKVFRDDELFPFVENAIASCKDGRIDPLRD